MNLMKNLNEQERLLRPLEDMTTKKAFESMIDVLDCSVDGCWRLDVVKHHTVNNANSIVWKGRPKGDRRGHWLWQIPLCSYHHNMSGKDSVHLNKAYFEAEVLKRSQFEVNVRTWLDLIPESGVILHTNEDVRDIMMRIAA